jgi:signal transduction histidine kinase
MKEANSVKDQFADLTFQAIADELDMASSKYHIIAAWVAIIFNPIFAYTDYINLHDQWQHVAIFRLSISLITLSTLFLTKQFKWPHYTIVVVPLMLISIQNAYAFSLIGNEDVLGHNINYIALLIGASMFLLLRVKYVVAIAAISALATGLSIVMNPRLDTNVFFVQGGLLLMVVAIFMVISIRTRYNLTLREIKARLALQASNKEIKLQAEEIKATNENLEILVRIRTLDLEKKNQALEEYAWINAHKLRSPVASILGLMSLLKREEVRPESRIIMNHLQSSTEQLDEVVSSITSAIERADYPDPAPSRQSLQPLAN